MLTGYSTEGVEALKNKHKPRRQTVRERDELVAATSGVYILTTLQVQVLEVLLGLI
jgi:hypothetical protein